jgi:hypothetical protein
MSGRPQPGRTIDRLNWQGAGNGAASRNGNGNGTGIEWASWLRSFERKRRLLVRDEPRRPRSLPSTYFIHATYSSFRLDGIDVTEHEVLASLASGPARQSLRSRAAQRIRNHVSILHHIESSIRIGESLKAPVVIRWYTTIGSGLITAALPDAMIDRLDQAVRRINSPQLRLQPALGDIARLHVQLLTDPLAPSFNGILARLLLRYHLGRVGLPPVVFEPEADAPALLDETMLLRRLLQLIDSSYDQLLRMEPV